MLLLVVVIVFVVVTGAAGYWYYQKTHAMGHLEVTTVPADAIALVDGQRLSGRSPFLIREKRGLHTLVVSRAGYVRREQTIELVYSDPPVHQKVTLEPTADTGFEIISEPPGADVWLDGFVIRDALGAPAHTNFRASRISPGRHVIEIKNSLVLPWRIEFDLEPDHIKRIVAVLTWASPGKLHRDSLDERRAYVPFPAPPGL